MNEKLAYITNNMKSLRIRSGYSQEETADLLGVSRTTYCDYETNPQKVKIETFKKLSEIFNCELFEFFLNSNVTKSVIKYATKDEVSED